MVKTTKRSKKFMAKGGAKQLEKKGTKLLNKKGNKAKFKKKNDGSNTDKEGKAEREERERQQQQSSLEKERSDKDFISEENLGELDMDSFFEKAVGMKHEEDDGSEDDSDEDSDELSENSIDDDLEDDDLASLGSEEEDLAASEARLKKQLEKLAQKDPEFHSYLKENESSLLEFGDDDESEGEDDDEEMDNEGAVKGASSKMAKNSTMKDTTAPDKFLLTPDRLEALEESAFASHSMKGLKRIISAYKTACHLSDASGQKAEDSDDEDAPKTKKKEFTITSPVVFDRLMAVCLAGCHEEFAHHLLDENKNDSDDDSGDSEGEDTAKTSKLDENKALNPKLFMKSPHWPTLKTYLESFLKSTLHLLSEAGKEANLLKFVLKALAKYVPFLSAFPRISKGLLKSCVKLWSAPLDTSQEYQVVRLQAFLRIRQLAITQPYPFIEDCLKMTYLSYAQRSKFGTASNVTTVLPTLTFMGNCIVEIYTLDYASAYQHAFVYIRQLALHLRTALMKKTKESIGQVYCWQYMHCLKLWVAVLCAAVGRSGSTESAASSKLGGGGGKDDEANLLRSLVYPLTEIILGVTRLVPVTRYTPLRLHCVRLLQQLAASTESFIPTTFLLLGVLDSKEVRAKPQRDDGRGKNNTNKSKSTVRGLRLPLILKLPKERTLRTIEQLDAVLKETFLLLNREIDLYRYSPGFPDFTFVILQRLRKVRGSL
jgi:nucleolar complex protein 2